MKNNIAFPDKSIIKMVLANFDSTNIAKLNIEDIRSKKSPIQVNQSFCGDHPDVIIPIENPISEIAINQYKIDLKVMHRNYRLKLEGVVIIKEYGYSNSEKNPHTNIIEYQHKMPMTNLYQVFAFVKVLFKKNSVECIHEA
jgi:hypothetical protein